MLERPNLTDVEIALALKEHYGITPATISFLPIGNDVNSFAFKMAGMDGAAFFLKARRGEIDTTALVIPRFVESHGVPAVAPIPTQSSELWVEAGEFKLIVYPFIEGASGMDAGMSDAQWIAYGAALRKMHDLALPADVMARLLKEDFSAGPYFQIVLKRVDALINTTTFNDDTLRDLASFWRDNAGEIKQLAHRAIEIGNRLNGRPWQGVLCHADIHTANVMVEQNGAIHFVDWDQPIFAPRERDLMFIVGANGSVGADARQETLFFRGYGEVDVDWPTLAYYRHLWVLQDLGDYAERAFLMNDVGDETRAHAAAGFKAMFNAGDVIEIARRAGTKID